MTVPEYKNLRRAYGFDEVALVPGAVTMNPENADVSFSLGDITFDIPVLASAMDSVVDPNFAVLLGKLGGLAVLNLEGVHTRYEDAGAVLSDIIQTPISEVTPLLQKVYSEPIKEKLVAEKVEEVKRGGVACAVSLTPSNAKRLSPIADEAGADVLFIQSTVTTARHKSKSYKGLNFTELSKAVSCQIVVGNCVSYEVALELMRTGITALVIGIGPGAACTTREVLGVGVPQITATMDCAVARDEYLRETGRYVSIITDGGFRSGGDLSKAFAAGADAVMLGSVMARSQEAPAGGYHWGMANPHPALPRGTRIKVGTTGSLEQILFGPAAVTDGSQNLIGALRTAMGVCSAANIKEMHRVEMVVAPAIKTEGKSWQLTQSY
ncbi:MAG: GuaB3 family IMP dehydrogenase-related protein [Dehalococcoidia bacterium]|nr:GuaB3 family IMP dehydrogenase-related protein [Dehalococcoidia bacterium]